MALFTVFQYGLSSVVILYTGFCCVFTDVFDDVSYLFRSFLLRFLGVSCFVTSPALAALPKKCSNDQRCRSILCPMVLVLKI